MVVIDKPLKVRGLHATFHGAEETKATYTTYNAQPRNGPKPNIRASLAVTDGVTPPIYYEFEILIAAADEHVDDIWDVDVEDNGSVDFNVTIDTHDGALVVVKNNGDLAYGIEFDSVIFWMELWMDLGDNAYWGTGDMYFGNVHRGVSGADNGADEGEMSGVVFRTDGSVDTYTGTGGGFNDIGGGEGTRGDEPVNLAVLQRSPCLGELDFSQVYFALEAEELEVLGAFTRTETALAN